MFDFVSFIPRAIMQGIPLLYGSTGETLTACKDEVLEGGTRKNIALGYADYVAHV